MALDIGLREVVAFEEQRLVQRPRQGVGKAVAKVEAGRMASFPVFLETLTCELRLVFIHRRQGDLCFGDEEIEISNTIGPRTVRIFERLGGAYYTEQR